MTTQEIVDKANKMFPSMNYQINANGRIFTNFMSRVKTWHTKQRLLDKMNHSIAMHNARVNCERVCEYLESRGAGITYTSTYGSKYFYLNGKLIRVSDHEPTQQLGYKDPDIYLMSYKPDGHLDMISKLEARL